MKVFSSIDNCWAFLLLYEMQQQGISTLCLAPGSRSTPLVMAAESLNFDIYVHWDERSLAFFALGLVKASLKPVALLCTSGTAVANFLPAVIEAYQSTLPLVLLTADRPFELQAIAANQSIHQSNIFKDFTVEQLVLPEPQISISAPSLLRRFSHAFHRMKKTCLPLHINMPLREPFFADLKSDFSDYLLPIRDYLQQESPFCVYDEPVHVFDEHELENVPRHYEQGLIVCGQLHNQKHAAAVLRLAEQWQWPILADPFSLLFSKQHPLILNHYDSAFSSFKNQAELKPFLCLWVGGCLLSKHLISFLSMPACYLLRAQEGPHLSDAAGPSRRTLLGPLLVTLSLLMKKKAFAKAPFVFPSTFSEETLTLKNRDQRSDRAFMKGVLAHFSADYDFFISNSLPPRLLLSWGPTFSRAPFFYANRGASGIDGIVSTALGLAKERRRPMVLLIGDLALMHDMGALALGENLTTSFVVICLNNSGGGIFSSLPVAKESQGFERFFQVKHDYRFNSLAQQFGYQYYCCESVEDFDSQMKLTFDLKGLSFIECLSVIG